MEARDVGTLTVQELKGRLDYDPETGIFLNKISIAEKFAGSKAGWIEPKTGYCRVKINGHKFMAHRLAWLYVHGEWPKAKIDHINGIRSDNRILNLREASDRQNSWNEKVYRTNELGVKCVRIHKSGKYNARIFNGVTTESLGLHFTTEGASRAYEKRAKELFGEFARAS